MPTTTRPSWQLPAMFGALAILAIAAWGAYAMRNVDSKPTAPTSTGAVSPPRGMAQLPSAAPPDTITPGQSVQLVVIIRTVGPGKRLTGTIVTAAQGGGYTTTSRRIDVNYARSGRPVMGSINDLQPGRHIDVTGIADADTTSQAARIDATQLVILGAP